MLHSIYSQIAVVAMLAICALTLFRGGPAEVWGAAAIFLTWVSGDVVALLVTHRSYDPVVEMVYLTFDCTLALSFLVLSLRFAKVWLGVAMLVQSAELALHGAEMADLGLSYRSYMIGNNIVSFLLLALLLGATLSNWRNGQRNARNLKVPVAKSAWVNSDRAIDV
jgi:hypothetical protein